MSKLKPKLFSVLKTYTKEQFFKDVFSGIIVAIIALPLSIALAIASGATPEVGIYTAIIGGFFVSLLGGSRVQIAGPTGAFMVIVFSVISTKGFDGLIIATLMAGFILVILGFFRLGSLVKFIPYPIITGFTSGIALVIFSSQVNDFFGMNLTNVPVEFLSKWEMYFNNISNIDFSSLLIGVVSLLILIVLPKYNKKVPAALVAIIVSVLMIFIFNIEVATVYSKFGELSSSLPKIHFPKITIFKIKDLIGPAIAIAFLGAVESLLSAVVSDGMIGSKHRSDMELIAQGTANVFSSLFGGLPVTGAIARTVANIKNGGRTPVAGIVHSLTLLLILVSLMPLVGYIPLPSLAAILFIVAYNMSEWRKFKMLLKSPKSDIIVLLTTFLLTVFFDLVLAIEVGLLLSVLLFMKRMSEVSDISVKNLDFAEDEDDFLYTSLTKKYDLSEAIKMYQINGPFFFGAAYKFVEAISLLGKDTKVLIIGMKHIPALDATAIHTFKETVKLLEAKDVKLLVTGLSRQPYKALEKADVINIIGEENIFSNIKEAVKKAKNELHIIEIKS
ncbi:sodium-independent anion transporter [Candidatus Izimaplasma bacterium ZiA1]|uniref:SulP family inorganic anion transporter n=1 Tax=Candidatus Izimoplasma sp. ZiA1 TaxID=2024899 RepID=UPI000BAA3C02|nr:sodium-independent anion transporter [Candidatus Izimaplasma bacterium ZiA1]